MKHLKIILLASINIIFGFVLYFISLRPLSPSEEQLIINFKGKTFFMFSVECFLFVLLFTFVFALLSHLTLKFLYKETSKKRKTFLTILTIYFIYTCICSIEYFNYISQLIYNK